MNFRILRPRKTLQQPITLFNDVRVLSNYLLEFSGDDIQQVKQLWKSNAARKSMVDFNEDEYKLQQLEYYRVYRSSGEQRKRLMPYLTVKNDVIRFAYNIRKKQRILTQGLINETAIAQDWYEQTLQLTKISLFAGFLIASGGMDIDNRTNLVDYWLGIVFPIFTAYNTKVEQMTAGTRELNGRLLLDADILAENIITSFENFRLNFAISQGARQGRRVPYGGDSCHDSGDRHGCIELAARGYEPIWKVVPIGMAACWHKCRCYIQYRWITEDNSVRTLR